MRWIRDLLLGADSGKVPSYGAVREEPDPIDWRNVEDRLVAATEQALGEFSSRHQDETFYGFGFDCNSDEGEVLLCFNSRVALRKAAKQTEGAYRVLSEETEAERLASMEWGFGDWKYQGFNARSKSWRQAWQTTGAEIAEGLAMLSLNRRHKQGALLREEFMRTACRALIRVTASETMSSIQRDPDFDVLCTDHDEGPDAGFARLRHVAQGSP